MAKLPSETLTAVFSLQNRYKKKLEFIMNQEPRIPDEETRKRVIAQIRASNRMLDELILELDELIAIVEADLREQRRKRLQATKVMGK